MTTVYPAVAPVPPMELYDLNSCAHSVQFYDDDAHLLDELSRFIGSALDAGDAGIVIATPAHRGGLIRRLEAQGLDVALATSEGRFVSADASDILAAFMRDGWPDAALFTEIVGGIVARATAATTRAISRVAAFGEMVAVLWKAGQHGAALRLEQLWNDLAQSHAFTLRCAYPMNLFDRVGDGDSIEQICAAHSRAIPAETYTMLATEDERLRAIALLQQKAQALETEIEERKKIQAALEQRNRELGEAVTARDKFLSVAAHELKTPVTSLRGFAQLLLRDVQRQREVAPARLAFALDTIDQQTGKLQQLVARLLDSARIEAGKLRIEAESVDLAELIHAILAQHRGQATHTIIFDGPAHLHAVVDPVRIEQVVTNLLDNAVKFSPHGSNVLVGLGRGDDGGVCFSVADQGMGIPPVQRESVFDRFHQDHGKSHLSGLGLGLYITRQIVELHGGAVRIEESEHGGTRLIVTLPPPATHGRE